MTFSSRPEHFEPADYLGVLRRRWWIVLAGVLVGALVGGVYAKTAPKTYTATSLVQVNAVPGAAGPANGRTNGPVNMDNEAQIVQSLHVASLAATQLHTALPAQDLVKHISVAVPANTTFLQISCAMSSAVAASRCADAVSNAYLTNRNDVAVSQISTVIKTLQAKITGFQTDITRYRAKLARLAQDAPSRTTDELRVSEDTSAISSALSFADQDEATLAGLDQPGNTAVGTMATPASVPTSPSSPRLLLVVPSGLLAGLVIALLIAFYLDRRDPRIRSAHDVERFLELPVLLDATGRGRDTAGGIASPRSKIGHAFSELAQYVAISLGQGSHMLMVTDMAAGEGGPFVGVNLALSLAKTRSTVVLILTSELPAGLSPLLVDASDRRGVAEVLAGKAAIRDVARRSAQASRLRVITAGSDPAGLLQTQHDQYRRFIEDLRHQADYVIVEARSIGDDANAFAICEFADATLAVVETAQTRHGEARDYLARLDRLHASVLGAAVLAGGPRSRAAAPVRLVPVAAERPDPAEEPTPVTKRRPSAGIQGKPSRSGRPSVLDEQPMTPAGVAAVSGETLPMTAVTLDAERERRSPRAAKGPADTSGSA